MTAPFTPPWAARVWLAGQTICVELPSTKGGAKSHSVVFPNTPEGLAQLLLVIRSRAPQVGLASKGDPLQSQLDLQQLLHDTGIKVRRPKPSITDRQRKDANEILRELNII